MSAKGLRQMAELRGVQPDLKRAGQALADAARSRIDRVAQRPLQRTHLLVGNVPEAVERTLGGLRRSFLAGFFFGHRCVSGLAVEMSEGGTPLYHAAAW